MAPKKTDRIEQLASELQQELDVYLQGTPEDRDRLVEQHGWPLAQIMYTIDALTKGTRDEREKAVASLQNPEMIALSGATTDVVNKMLNKPKRKTK